jgi:putative DNA primase/helicase
VPLRNLPTTVRNLFTGAAGCSVLAYDNVGVISPEISDALCQIVSGSGFATRKLYSDTAQVLVGGYRSVILNGLQNAITQSDLADRALVLPMVRISSDQRRLDSQVWPLFEARRGQIFGALLDGVSCGLRNLDSVQLRRLPRMADFARWVVATQAFQRDVFLRAFEGSQTEATETVAENNPVIIAIVALMEGRDEWHGTAVQLIAELSTRDKAEAKPTKWRSWPADASAFGRKLSAATATLRRLGIVVTKGRARDRKSSRLIWLKKTVSDVSAASGAEATDSTDGSDSKRDAIERMAA